MKSDLVGEDHEPKVGRVVFIGDDLDCKVVGWLGCKGGSDAVDVVCSEVGERSRLEGGTGLVLRTLPIQRLARLTGVVQSLGQVLLCADQMLPDEISRWLSIERRSRCESGDTCQPQVVESERRL